MQFAANMRSNDIMFVPHSYVRRRVWANTLRAVFNKKKSPIVRMKRRVTFDYTFPTRLPVRSRDPVQEIKIGADELCEPPSP